MDYDALIKKEAMDRFNSKVEDMRKILLQDVVTNKSRMAEAIKTEDIVYIEAFAKVLVGISHDGVDLLACALLRQLK